MPAFIDDLAARLETALGSRVQRYASLPDECAIDVPAADLLGVAQVLRDDPQLRFEQLIDLSGVDYLAFGKTEWSTTEATDTGFSRGVDRTAAPAAPATPHRFAVVAQLMSVRFNRRLRLRVWCPDDEEPMIDSLTDVWASANWYEREAFDLFGILFRNHPDLRRLLTDYGFVGHPFRKDFPLIGHVEVRYDEAQRRVAYEPVSIEPRTLVPRVIREDNRNDPALHGLGAAPKGNTGG